MASESKTHLAFGLLGFSLRAHLDIAAFYGLKCIKFSMPK